MGGAAEEEEEEAEAEAEAEAAAEGEGGEAEAADGGSVRASGTAEAAEEAADGSVRCFLRGGSEVLDAAAEAGSAAPEAAGDESAGAFYSIKTEKRHHPHTTRIHNSREGLEGKVCAQKQPYPPRHMCSA